MAITKKQSQQLLDAAASITNKSSENAKLRIACFDFSQGKSAGSAGSTADLVVLPGQCRIIPALSRVTTSALGHDFNIGIRSYKGVKGEFVAEDDKALASALEGEATSKNFNIEGYIDVNSREGVTIFAKGTFPANSTLKGYVAYLVD